MGSGLMKRPPRCRYSACCAEDLVGEVPGSAAARSRAWLEQRLRRNDGDVQPGQISALLVRAAVGDEVERVSGRCRSSSAGWCPWRRRRRRRSAGPDSLSPASSADELRLERPRRGGELEVAGSSGRRPRRLRRRAAASDSAAGPAGATKRRSEPPWIGIRSTSRQPWRRNSRSSAVSEK